jgi:hypothetical protein
MERALQKLSSVEKRTADFPEDFRMMQSLEGIAGKNVA